MEFILADLLKTCQTFMGLNISASTPIQRGWLNLKWKITTDKGNFLLKQYNKERYRLYNPEDLLFAFSQQIRLHGQGLPCPKLVAYEGDVLFESGKGEKFVLMEYCEGSVIPAGKLNGDQMYELGRVTGRMHGLLNDGTSERKSSPQFIPPSREERLDHWKSVWNKADETGKTQLLPAIEAQYKTTETINMEVFDLRATGWAHRDLWVDNLLFKEDRVSAILDFDRLKYDYPQLDAARAVLSGALDDDKINASIVLAFLEGYSEEHSIAKGFLTSALRLLWYMESTWWINPDMDQHSVSPARFAKEMIWLAENHHELEAVLGDI